MNTAIILMIMFLTVRAPSTESNERTSGYTRGSPTFRVSPFFPAWVHAQMYEHIFVLQALVLKYMNQTESGNYLSSWLGL